MGALVNTYADLLPRKRSCRIAILGNSLPRHCGIATFTDDLACSVAATDPTREVHIFAMSDRPGYRYPERVCLEIDEQDLASYRRAADFINRSGYEVLSVQHEYGIFGGEAGCYLLELVREVKMPIVTTLHTVLDSPSAAQKAVMDELLQLSERVVVMSEKAAEILIDVHDVCPDKIDLIPHGIHEHCAKRGQEFRSQLAINGPMILTFGLLSPDKGIQYVIEAMPDIVREHPGATYVVVGATHPHVRASAGEAYRASLEELARDLGVGQNVRFVNRFVETTELVDYMGAMDFYITPYLNVRQITSGTLAYSFCAGKPVISTPYWFAEELLAEGRGILVPFRDPAAISKAILSIQGDPEAKHEMGRRAAEYGRKMFWPEVAKCYQATFARARRDSADHFRELLTRPAAETEFVETLPSLRLNHLFDLSDDTGILQHATHAVPNRAEGYCVDDNARALLYTVYLEAEGPLMPEVARLQGRYLSFVHDAYNPETGRFRNFMGYRRNWLESSGSEDSHGRSLWALGATVRNCRNMSRLAVAKKLALDAAEAMYATTSPRTWAYGVLAADEYLRAFPLEISMRILLETMANRILHLYETNRSNDWKWFEQILTYGNARLPQALILAGQALERPEMVVAGLESLEWLMDIQTVTTQGNRQRRFAPIGSNGFYPRHGERAMFDQQPIEAAGAISACLTAARLTRDPVWSSHAQRAFRWFLGDNMAGLSLYDPLNGGCYDGLHPDKVNRNQGAESTLSFLCAQAEMRRLVVPSSVQIIKGEVF